MARHMATRSSGASPARSCWAGAMPDAEAGYRSSARSRDVGDATVFARVASALLNWDVHRGAGFRLIEATEVATVGGLFIARAPYFPVTSRCEVTAVLNEPTRRGFTYRTLPGHPLEGEENFLVEVVNARTIFTVTEHSRPAAVVTRIPGARWVQGRINHRYLAVAAKVAATAPSP